MPLSPVVYLPVRPRPAAHAPRTPRVFTAFTAALLRAPPEPVGIAACIGYLKDGDCGMGALRLGMRALQNLRASLFSAPGRHQEMALLWRESLATACYARAVAHHAGFDAPLLTGAGLLHHAGEIIALRALAQAEIDAGVRLAAPAMRRLLESRDDELVARVTRSWALPGEVRLLIQRWRAVQEQCGRDQAVDLLTMAQALATELVHGATCTPGLVSAARDALRMPQGLEESARAATAGIEALLAQAAPAPRI